MDIKMEFWYQKVYIVKPVFVEVSRSDSNARCGYKFSEVQCM